MPNITFATTIREARDRAGITQLDLAERLGYSPQYLSDIEQGRRNPATDRTIERFAKELNLDTDYLSYLSGLFPPIDRQSKMTFDQFSKAIKAFRSSYV